MKHPSLFSAKLLVLCVLAFSAQPVFAQKIAEGVFQRQVKFALSPDSSAHFSIYEVRDSMAFRTLKIREANFPLTIVKKPVVDPFFDLVLQYEAQIMEHHNLQKGYTSLDSIQQQTILQLQRLNDIQGQRVANYKQLSDDMIASNALLNDQLNHALGLAKDCNRGKTTKRLWAAAVGAGVGFTLAGLIAFLK